MKESGKNNTGFSTRAIHYGYDPTENQGALNPPIHMSSTFVFEKAEHGGEMFAGERDGHIYSRISNPTLSILENRIANLEGAEASLGTASGMGAITSTIWALISAGEEIIIDKTLYGCTFAYLTHGLTRFGVKVTLTDLTNPDNLKEAISDNTKIVYFETPANPNNRIIDIAAVSEIVHRHGAKLVVDNTYATPVITRPIELGADIVVHSATKFLGGHGDIIAGLVVGSKEDIHNIRVVGVKDMTGAVMAPLTAMLIMRGLKTLELRMERHCANAMKVAEALENHPAVLSVSYPGLKSFGQRDLATRQMTKFGGMIPFEIVGGKPGGIAMMNRLNLISRAVSLGDAESLIQHPASMTHSTYSPEERAKHGIGEGLVRLSVGLEDPEDIIDDLKQALGKHNEQVA